ncbi:MAG: heavy metal translocating P-type ATPase, partial [Gemmatimonadetes bacterium]|nr:heavy metal translocating P-type ATPase [Gemmatimonadota bacterium]
MPERELTFAVTGMTCANCAGTVERTLRKTPGVTEASVNYGSERATVTFESAEVTEDVLADRIRDAGYDAPTRDFDLAVTGMTCANCAATIQRTLRRRVPGVTDASVNFASEHARVSVLAGTAERSDLVREIERAGFGVVDEAPGPGTADADDDPEARARAREIERQRRAFIVGLAFTIPLFAFSMARDFGLLGAWAHAAWANLAMWALATPVQFYTGWDYYVGAFKALRNRTANMDVLVSLGSSVAYAWSVPV